MTEYNVIITITSIETDSDEKLEKEVWRMRRMLELMAEISDPAAIKTFYSINSSIEAVKE